MTKHIVGYAIDRETGIYRSDGLRQAEPPYLDYLLDGYQDQPIQVMANMPADVANLLALVLDPGERLQLYTSTNERLRIPPYNLRYFADSLFFGIDKGFGAGMPTSTFSDMAQYDEELEALQDRHDPEYWFGRAKRAQEVGESVYTALTNLSFKPDTLSSPASSFRKGMLKGLGLPNDKDVPDGATEYAYRCCKGNWFEAFSIGHFDHVYDYDLNSAYPAVSADLLDLRRGMWTQTDKYQDRAVYGYCRCEVMIDAKFSPIMHIVGKGNSYTPTGKWTTCLTKAEIDFIEKHELGTVLILDGWWWTPNTSQPLHTPLKGVVNWLYDRKQSAEGTEKEVVKRVLVGGLYGVFRQLSGNRKGQFFLAPYSAEIETNVRLKVAEACLDQNIVPLYVAVDGMVTNKPLQLPISDKLGDWKLSNEGKGIIVNSGLACIEGKVGTGEFSVGYDQLVEMINRDPDADAYELQRVIAVSLGTAVEDKRLEDIGKLEPVSRVINITYDKKRRYRQRPKTGEELLSGQYKSLPYDVRDLKLRTKLKEDIPVIEDTKP